MALHRAREASDVKAEVRDAVNQTGYSLFKIGLSLFRNSEPKIAGLQDDQYRTPDIAERFFHFVVRNLTFPFAFLNP
jgi:hypothetical protein